MRVAVIGAGYVGLVSAAGLAFLGHKVQVGEADPKRLAKLQDGQVPFYEPELDRLVSEGMARRLLSFHGDNRRAVNEAEVVFIALPTPEGPEGAGDVSIIEEALDELAPALEAGSLVAVRSTVPVGTARRLQERLDRRGVEATVISNPEFLREGSAVSQFLHPDRIVVGTDDRSVVDRMVALYLELEAPVVVTDPVSAEMIKYASNAYLAMRITFANSIANACEVVGADVTDVVRGMGYDTRIGSHFMNPGPGYGGSCLPKDTRALVAGVREAGYDFSLLREVIEVNEAQRLRVVDKVRAAVGGQLAGTAVGLWGLAFKAGTDDLRESPAVDLAFALVAEGARVRAYDPKAALRGEGIEQVGDPIEAAKGADVLLVATEWAEFQGVDLKEVRDAMRGDAIVDARNLLDPLVARRLGLRYVGVGR